MSTSSKQLTTINVSLAGAPPTEVSADFFKYMANRMAVSYHKYGPVADAKDIDLLASAEQRVAKYTQDGNTEWLVDAANFLMMQFMKDGPSAFQATDSDASPGRTRTEGGIDAERN